MASANIPRSPLGEKRISLSAAFKQLYDRPSINALQGKGKAKKVITRDIRNRRRAIAASSSMAAEAEGMEETLDMIEVEDTEAFDTMEAEGEITENGTVAQELEEELRQEMLLEEYTQEQHRIQKLKEAEKIGQAFENSIAARITRETVRKEQLQQQQAVDIQVIQLASKSSQLLRVIGGKGPGIAHYQYRNVSPRMSWLPEPGLSSHEPIPSLSQVCISLGLRILA